MVLFVSACNLTTLGLPTGAEEFVPPPVYQQWWALTEECAGVSGRFAEIRWYRVPGTEWIPRGSRTSVSGRWEPHAKRILLAADAQRAGDLVRHEMLHALLKSGGHPRSAFVGRCAGVVVCTRACITDGGPAEPPDEAAVVVEPGDLRIGVELKPSAPGATVNGGNFVMIVSAENLASRPVVVRLPPSGDAGPSGSFSYRIEGTAGTTRYDMRAEVPEVTRFAPHEIKRFIFDFRVAPPALRYDQPPGEFRFNGAYGGAWAPNAPLITVSP